MEKSNNSGYQSFSRWQDSRDGHAFISDKDWENINDFLQIDDNDNAKANNGNRSSSQQKPSERQNNFKNKANNNNSNNFYNSRYSKSKPKELMPGAKKITFQLISNTKISIKIEPYPPSQKIIAIIRNFNSFYNRETSSWELDYQNYSQIYKAFKSSDIDGAELVPIPVLPLTVIQNKPKPDRIQFKSSPDPDLNKKDFVIDYTNDINHSLADLPEKLKNSLYDFQRGGINFGISRRGRFLLADEMGVGKTIQAIGLCSIFKEDWPVLIVCPSSLKLNWRDELIQWLGDIVNPSQIQVIKTSKDEFKNQCKFHIISYDLSIRVLPQIRNMCYQFIIADEAHYLKNTNAKRTQGLIPIMQRAKRLLFLTGTPIVAKPVEAFPILNALRPDIFTNFKTFGMRYCNPVTKAFGVDWSGSSNAQELHFILSRFMIRRLKNDVLAQLPPKKRQKVSIEPEKKCLKQIKLLLTKSKNDVKLENDDILKKLDILDVKLANDHSEKGDEDNALNCFTKAYLLTGQAKIPGIKEYVSYLVENHCKFLIFAHHTEVLDAIQEAVEKLKVDYMRIDGSTPINARHDAVHKFQNKDNCLVAILSITACATGLTLTKASTVVFAEMHFTPATLIQAEDRAHRIGQEHECVNIHYLYAAETVDEILFTKISEKQKIVTSTLDNKASDMCVQKIKEKVGDFKKGAGAPKSGVKLSIEDYFKKEGSNSSRRSKKEFIDSEKNNNPNSKGKADKNENSKDDNKENNNPGFPDFPDDLGNYLEQLDKMFGA